MSEGMEVLIFSKHFIKISLLLLIEPMGVFISWATPATSCPREAIFSD